MGYWLMKSEPSTFSIDDLKAKPSKTEHWDGIRNYQARNFMRDEMKKGDEVFFYHSSCEVPGIVGIVKVVKEAYPDFTAYDPDSKYFDPKSTDDNPRWFMVDVKFVTKFPRVITIKELKTIPALSDMQVCRKGNRLSITPVTAQEWQAVMTLV